MQAKRRGFGLLEEGSFIARNEADPFDEGDQTSLRNDCAGMTLICRLFPLHVIKIRAALNGAHADNGTDRLP